MSQDQNKIHFQRASRERRSLEYRSIIRFVISSILWKLHGLSKWHRINQRNTKNNGV